MLITEGPSSGVGQHSTKSGTSEYPDGEGRTESKPNGTLEGLPQTDPACDRHVIHPPSYSYSYAKYGEKKISIPQLYQFIMTDPLSVIRI